VGNRATGPRGISESAGCGPVEFIFALPGALRVFFRSRRDTAIEILALQQQVVVLKRKRPRPKLNTLDRLFWTTLRRVWSRWADVFVIVKSETVAGWHRAGFRLYWRRGDPAKRWLAFLQNHREVIAAFDFFTVPTVTFNLLYYFFVIEDGRRRILHFNVIRHPTAEWVVQKLREAFSEAGPYRYVILDRDSKFDAEVITFRKPRV
jgi:hypothetical protein